VLPLVRARVPAAELWLAGPHANKLDGIRERPGVRVLGYVDDLPGLFAQVRALVAPLYSGAGFRMKGLSALAHGVPVVTNDLGARGIEVPVTARTIVESDADLAAAAVRLLTDATHAAAAGSAAHAWAQHNLAADAVAAAQLERIAELLRQRR
jgi:glycosyltransferase involved in cell wall biosynthesis